MSNYFITYEKKDCCGCGVCALKCPKNAIKMEEDIEGFLYPVIDKNKCINCKLCEKICPNKQYAINKMTKTYIAINKNEKQLRNSSSGGCFFPIANYILLQDGIVYGVKYNNEVEAIHDYTDNIDGLKQFQGSKYVRSNLNNAYNGVKKFLEEDRYVLFTGTPCQCQGLRTFLGKEYDKLYTCEIICHANSSPKIFKKYKRNLEIKNNKKVAEIKFRAKSNGWKNQKTIITFDDGSETEDISFYKGFVNELYNRPSCHNCNFCSSNRLSDFTIGDAWGIQEFDSSIEDNDTGISLFCINTEKGMKLKSYLEKNIFLKETDTETAFKHNHYKNVPEHKYRKEFFEKVSEGIINEENIINNIERYTKVGFCKKCINKIKSILNKIKRI